jgi:RNA polymerase sigma-70 factor (ECF subfamily)
LDYSAFDDEALLRLIAHARADALSVLYDRYARLIYSLAYRIVGDPSAAEEVTQDVFLRVWEKANTYQSEQAKVSTWLVSIARHRAIDLVRQRGARAEGYSAAWEDLPQSIIPRTEGRNPEELSGQAIQAKRVREAIATLPVEQRQALAMAFLQGYSHSEIAEKIGEPLGTVKTRIRLAMQKLHHLLSDEQLIA